MAGEGYNRGRLELGSDEDDPNRDISFLQTIKWDGTYVTCDWSCSGYDGTLWSGYMPPNVTIGTMKNGEIVCAWCQTCGHSFFDGFDRKHALSSFDRLCDENGDVWDHYRRETNPEEYKDEQ